MVRRLERVLEMVAGLMVATVRVRKIQKLPTELLESRDMFVWLLLKLVMLMYRQM